MRRLPYEHSQFDKDTGRMTILQFSDFENIWLETQLRIRIIKMFIIISTLFKKKKQNQSMFSKSVCLFLVCVCVRFYRLNINVFIKIHIYIWFYSCADCGFQNVNKVNTFSGHIEIDVFDTDFRIRKLWDRKFYVTYAGVYTHTCVHTYIVLTCFIDACIISLSYRLFFILYSTLD